jgi:hypothetical protein
MSKFLLNLLLQISKALVYSKIKFLFGKEFSFTFGPIGPAAAHLFSNRPLPLSPLGLSLSAGPARRLGPADRASVAPCPIAAFHSRKCISEKPPSLHECVLHRKSATSARPISAGPATTPTWPWPAGRPKPPSPPPRPTGFIARSAQAAHLATRVFFLLRTKATRPPPPLRATTAPPCAAAPASPPP